MGKQKKKSKKKSQKGGKEKEEIETMKKKSPTKGKGKGKGKEKVKKPKKVIKKKKHEENEQTTCFSVTFAILNYGFMTIFSILLIGYVSNRLFCYYDENYILPIDVNVNEGEIELIKVNVTDSKFNTIYDIYVYCLVKENSDDDEVMYMFEGDLSSFHVSLPKGVEEKGVVCGYSRFEKGLNKKKRKLLDLEKRNLDVSDDEVYEKHYKEVLEFVIDEVLKKYKKKKVSIIGHGLGSNLLLGLGEKSDKIHKIFLINPLNIATDEEGRNDVLSRYKKYSTFGLFFSITGMMRIFLFQPKLFDYLEYIGFHGDDIFSFSSLIKEDDVKESEDWIIQRIVLSKQVHWEQTRIEFGLLTHLNERITNVKADDDDRITVLFSEKFNDNIDNEVWKDMIKNSPWGEKGKIIPGVDHSTILSKINELIK